MMEMRSATDLRNIQWLSAMELRAVGLMKKTRLPYIESLSTDNHRSGDG